MIQFQPGAGISFLNTNPRQPDVHSISAYITTMESYMGFFTPGAYLSRILVLYKAVTGLR